MTDTPIVGIREMKRPIRNVLQALTLIFLGLLFQATARAQSSDTPAAPDSSPPSTQQQDDPSVTMFDHSNTSRFWISGQANAILQWHSSFPAKYNGVNSLRPVSENAMSRIFTLYTGVELTKTTEVICDIEEANGHGISEALGFGGVTNVDVVRNTTLSHAPYLARLMVREIIPLSKEQVEAERSPLSLATSLPARRLEIRAGKFSMPDFFDLNAIGSDSHLQFMNWTVVNNGAWDYAADTRGYTWGVMVEYDDRKYSLRFAEALMPKIANGIQLVWNLRRAHAENLELELRRGLIPKRAGTIRLMAYVNHANMGSYRTAIDQFLSGQTPVPDVTAHSFQVRSKYGFTANIEQGLTHLVRLYARAGWNDGRNESFAYTEVDNTIAVGADLKGDPWRRRLDRVGATFVDNGISKDHREYLRLGGSGFLLGDGALTYGREGVFEGYYTAHVWRGIFAALDLQHITNPGYNRDRGPVLVPGFRIHIDF
ncbi:MAG TPA: carbohydrate porin [Blastocatellia bacterium]|nr:carbohydrate porin [Blastocatellia bacterium]